MDAAVAAEAAGTLTGPLARFGAAFSLDDVPEDDRRCAKLLLLDLLGCALAGLDTEEARISRRAGRALSPGGGCAAFWGVGEAAQPGIAAMVNGAAAHALELDDFHGVDHSGAMTVPALMAAADAGRETDGRRFLEGMVFGYEVGRRLLDGGGGREVPGLRRAAHGLGARHRRQLHWRHLVLQLRILSMFIVGDSGRGLVFSSPEGPLNDVGRPVWGLEDEACEKGFDFGDRGNESGEECQAAIAGSGLVSFRLPDAARRRSAASLARKAAAAMTRLTWRCHPCQERASQ